MLYMPNRSAEVRGTSGMHDEPTATFDRRNGQRDTDVKLGSAQQTHCRWLLRRQAARRPRPLQPCRTFCLYCL